MKKQNWTVERLIEEFASGTKITFVIRDPQGEVVAVFSRFYRKK